MPFRPLTKPCLVVVLACLAAAWGVVQGVTLTGTYDFSPNTLRMSELLGDSVPYDVVEIDGCRQDDGLVGAPQLPLKTLLFLIPWGEKLQSVDVTVVEAETLDHANLIWPIQPLSCSLSMYGGFYYPDMLWYTVGYPSGHCDGEATSTMSNYCLASVDLRPVRMLYDGRLELATQMQVALHTAAGNDLCPGSPVARQSPLCAQMRASEVAALVENPEATTLGYDYPALVQPPHDSVSISDMPSQSGDCVDCVIITEDAAAAAYEQYADFLWQRGFVTALRTLGWIDANYVGRDRAERVREFIKDAHYNWGVGFVILAGWQSDHHGLEGLPTRLVEWPGAEPYWAPDHHGPLKDTTTTDQYFADLEGTWDENGNGSYGEPTGWCGARSFAFGSTTTGCVLGVNPKGHCWWFWTTDGGVNWSETHSRLPYGHTSVDIAAVSSDVSYTAVAFTNSENSHSDIYRTTNAGRDWALMSTVQPNYVVTCMASPRPDVIWTGGLCYRYPSSRTKLAWTTDGGQDWATREYPDGQSATDICCEPVEQDPPQRVWASEVQESRAPRTAA